MTLSRPSGKAVSPARRKPPFLPDAGDLVDTKQLRSLPLNRAVNHSDATRFRQICEEAGLAVTHQRQIIYEVLTSTAGHPSPEEVYARVKRRIPSISLATVYKNIHLFIDSGIFQQVSLHHGSMRVETNQAAHHHLVCTECKSITDVDAEVLGLQPVSGKLPGGFLPQRVSVDVLGVCESCQALR
jgi:Fur family transcriptional regulator, peroxide stress response regulator